MPRILYVQYTNPAAYPPLEHSSGLLAENGWEVLFLGAEVRGAERLRLVPRSTLSVPQLPAWPPGWPDRLRYAWFMVWVLVWWARWRPTWVYASDPHACPVTLVLSYLPGINVVYHEHE